MDQEQVRLGLIAAAERQLGMCSLLARGERRPRETIVYDPEIDLLRVEDSQATDPTTLAGSLVIARIFLEEVADASFHGVPWHNIPWRETSVCLEEILRDLRETQPVQSQTLTDWWNRSGRSDLPLASTSTRRDPTNLPQPSSKNAGS